MLGVTVEQQLEEAHEHSDARSGAYTPHVHDQAVLIEELREQSAFLHRELEVRTQEQRLETIEAS